jgi:uncharacterized protein YwgA
MATHESITPSTAILVLASQCPQGQLAGRTRTQKLLYFLRERLPIAASYTPYYYGPYSEEVTASLDSLVARGLLQEQVEPVDTEGPFEGRLHRYMLTRDGREVLDSLRLEHRDEVVRIEEAAGEVLGRNASTATLAVASKLHYIVKSAAKPVPQKELSAKARGFGWHVDPSEIANGVKFLLGMGLVTKGS